MIHYTKQERVEVVRRKLKKLCPVCWQDTVILVVVMTVALDMGLLLQPVGADDSHAALIFCGRECSWSPGTPAAISMGSLPA